MSDTITRTSRVSLPGAHAAATRFRIVPASGFGYAPNGRSSMAPAFVARHAASVTGIGAAAALVGSSATAIALMLGLGR